MLSASRRRLGRWASNQLLATYSNNGAAVATNAANNAAYVAATTSNNNANELTTAMNTIIPWELAHGGTGAAVLTLPGQGTTSIASGALYSPTYLESIGFSAADAQRIANG